MEYNKNFNESEGGRVTNGIQNKIIKCLINSFNCTYYSITWDNCFTINHQESYSASPQNILQPLHCGVPKTDCNVIMLNATQLICRLLNAPCITITERRRITIISESTTLPNLQRGRLYNQTGVKVIITRGIKKTILHIAPDCYLHRVMYKTFMIERELCTRLDKSLLSNNLLPLFRIFTIFR